MYEYVGVRYCCLSISDWLFSSRKQALVFLPVFPLCELIELVSEWLWLVRQCSLGEFGSVSGVFSMGAFAGCWAASVAWIFNGLFNYERTQAATWAGLLLWPFKSGGGRMSLGNSFRGWFFPPGRLLCKCVFSRSFEERHSEMPDFLYRNTCKMHTCKHYITTIFICKQAVGFVNVLSLLLLIFHFVLFLGQWLLVIIKMDI